MSTFLSEYYTGIENILKCICRYYSVTLPVGEYWHIELFKLFSSKENIILPILFDEELKGQFEPLRRFRHVVHHGYSFKIDWQRLKEGINQIEYGYEKFKFNLYAFLQKNERP